MKKLCLLHLGFMTTLFTSCLALAEELEEGKVYRLHKTVHNIELARDTTQKHIAVKESKFTVVDTTNANYYVINFVTLYNFKSDDNTITRSTVTTDEDYFLPKTIHGVPTVKSTSISRGGPVSGPLIVPFKYRTDDKTLTGDAALGYYAGYSIEPKIPFTEVRIPVTPFIAGGLSQISVTEGTETTNQTGITLAFGILVQNWGGVNIGIVYGQDRIGDKDWVHEGENWLSFMVGWEI